MRTVLRAMLTCLLCARSARAKTVVSFYPRKCTLGHKIVDRSDSARYCMIFRALYSEIIVKIQGSQLRFTVNTYITDHQGVIIFSRTATAAHDSLVQLETSRAITLPCQSECGCSSQTLTVRFMPCPQPFASCCPLEAVGEHLLPNDIGSPPWM